MPQTKISVRVPFFDVDSSQRIHYTAMLRYMELAEHELMRQIGFPYATTLRDIAFPRVHVSCDFRGAIRFDDQLSIQAFVERVGNSSWSIIFTARALLKEEAGEEGAILAQGRMTIVAMDPLTERARSIPDELRQALLGEVSEQQ